MAKKEDLKRRMGTGIDALIRSTEDEKEASVTDDKEKDVRCNFIMSKKYHTRLKMLALQRETSLKAIVEDAFALYFKTIDNE
jgi:predicted HicB family RNase H-like nuclease